MTVYREIKTDDEIKQFVPIADSIWHEFWDSRISKPQVDYMLSNFQSYESVKKQIDEGYEYYFIFQEGEIAGYTGICPKKSYMFLSKLYLKKIFRGKHLGRRTLDFIAERARFHNLTKIRLTVNKYNEATIAAYKKWGFVTVDSVITDIGGGFVMDDFIMELKV